VIGVGAGVVSSILLGLYHFGRMYWMRLEQVRYLRRCIIDSFTKIQNDLVAGDLAKDFPQLAPTALRPAIFEGFMRHMTAAMNYRTAALTDNQIFDLRNAMGAQEHFVSFVKSGTERAARGGGVDLPMAPRLPEDLNFYRDIYKGFAEIKWLKLPEDIDSNPKIST